MSQLKIGMLFSIMYIKRFVSYDKLCETFGFIYPSSDVSSKMFRGATNLGL